MAPRPGMVMSVGTFLPDFNKICDQLSDKPPQRPARLRTMPAVSNNELRDIAKRNPPPREWFEGEEERPF